jgi:hypothetical protein
MIVLCVHMQEGRWVETNFNMFQVYVVRSSIRQVDIYRAGHIVM